MIGQSVRIVVLYRFTRFEDVAQIRATLARVCARQSVRGTLLLAPEGINGTIAGSDSAIDAVLAHVRTLPGCAGIEVKESRAAEMPFHRMKVRIKREIVTMGQPAIDPAAGTGTYVEAEDWNALIDDPDTILIDTRNDYEVAVGSFAGAIDPGTRTFGEFPAWFRERRRAFEDRDRPPRIAMFCTGGIRCEKATAFLKAEGVDQVYHLKGGILAYLEKVAPAASRWEGECFVFDERVAITHGLQPGTHHLCRACRMPVSSADRESPLYEEGIACPSCYAARNDEQRSRYAERERQVRLAARRGDIHVGRRPD